ncbi:ADP-ribosylation factor-like 2-like protein [Conidiobolus coronatus NRRL 28638]|uniref:ADP-ribosylation factor-like protein 2 n=1 Tax=Conidiobolus coronatus (strain ATCC 28846 / CBS 209.66 / NRRL 28638) TaxID=796925 RepID=A0A137PHG8_CONC2|nr:ADP-ribosylation factor-like 2-like protein [Conidiobolus coronatus NRRL 28638]|eukprot:KXN74381.1 ADP-ribosylation factor-like 2-like protein [Conidiobolus coronatus NRRL 28638]
MGLLTIIRKQKLKEKQMRVLILGLDNAGKTTIVKKLKGEDISEISPTLGFNIQSFDYDGYTVDFWDIGGQKSIRAYWKNYFENTEGLIWVVDSSDLTRLQDCKTELFQLMDQERLAGATVLILANKQDIKGALTAEEIQTYLELEKIEKHHWAIYPCSGVTGDNVLDAVDWIIKDIATRIYLFD